MQRGREDGVKERDLPSNPRVVKKSNEQHWAQWVPHLFVHQSQNREGSSLDSCMRHQNADLKHRD